ncbi:MAG: L-histidine N(alpha)-methyltransferase [Candidatus Neomarinimicrobiota bacterium]
MTTQTPLVDSEVGTDVVRREVLSGLQKPVKELPCKLFYDEKGARLFDEICDLDEYYLTRTEIAIIESKIGEIASLMGPHCLLVEYGSGSSRKSRLLLDNLKNIAAYVPIDICREQLMEVTASLCESYPDLDVLPVCADFTGDFELPKIDRPVSKRVVFFPGSTIGNFHPREVVRFLRHIAGICGEGGGLLIGVDLVKDPLILHEAYDDPDGVTAQFNMNILERINRELGADFQTGQFSHFAVYNENVGRVEMHLVSQTDQEVRVDGVDISFGVGETIWTESAYKYSPERFRRLAGLAGFNVEKTWTDERKLFSVHYLTVSLSSSVSWAPRKAHVV